MNEWFIARNKDEHFQNALEWQSYKSDTARKHFVKNIGVRWSELLRLQYFNPNHFLIIDSMHCLFLGIAR